MRQNRQEAYLCWWGKQVDVDSRAENHVNKLFSLSILVKMSSYRKGGVYYEGLGEEWLKLVGTTKDVDESEVFRTMLQALSSEEKDCLPSGWVKWRERDQGQASIAACTS